VANLMKPQTPREATALVALMLLHDARREARLDEAGEIVVLEEQDRGRWKQEQIREALPLVEEAVRETPGPLALQAAIAAVHCRAARAEETDWKEIVRLYDALALQQPSPVVSTESRGGCGDGGGAATWIGPDEGIGTGKRFGKLSFAACGAGGHAQAIGDDDGGRGSISEGTGISDE